MYDDLKKSQPIVMNILVNSFKKGRLSHAYLFVGEKGTKKLDFAYYFAKMLYCKEDEPCGKCDSCKRIDTFVHPNIYFIEPVNGVIKKEQITSLMEEFAMSSLEPGPKVYIINQADKMNASSANSLLKVLEEPDQVSYAILITENLNLMLKTIISRSQIINFQPLNKEILRQELVLKGFDDILVNVLPEYTNNITEMIKIADDDDMFKIISLVTEIFNVEFEKGDSLVIYLNEHGELLYKDKDKKEFFLSLIIMYFKDLLRYISYKNEDFVFKSESKRIKQLCNILSKEQIIMFLEKILDLKAKLKFNINDKLILDDLLYNLGRSTR